jgi:C1A family cysteine protease
MNNPVPPGLSNHPGIDLELHKEALRRLQRKRTLRHTQEAVTAVPAAAAAHFRHLFFDQPLPTPAALPARSFVPVDAVGQRLATPVQDQRKDDCSAFATIAAAEGWLCREQQKVVSTDFSEADLFRCARKRHPEFTLKTAAATGVVDEVFHRANPSVKCDAPSRPARRIAYEHVIEPRRGSMIVTMCQALRERGPLLICIVYYSSFEQHIGSGVYQPRAGESATAIHALCVVGYETTGDGTGVWLAKNSFGEAWGDAGYVRVAWGDRNLRPEQLVYVIDHVTP